MTTFTLNTGRTIPALGLGTWKSKTGEVQNAVEVAIRAGYRHIDCAPVYANQAEVGQGLAAVFADGTVSRDQVFITSKVFPTVPADKYEEQCRTTLKDLGLEYLDLYLIHWPLEEAARMEDMWRALEALQAKGLVKDIGVSNFSIKKLRALLQYAKVVPAVNQVEMHPTWRQDALVSFCASQGILLTAYCPLGSPDQFLASGLNRQAPGAIPLHNPAVISLASDLGKTPAQVLLRWGIQRGTGVLPKSVTPSRIEENMELFSWELPAEGMAALSSLEPQYRLLHGAFHTGPGRGFRTLEDLWDEDVSYLRARSFERPDGFALTRADIGGEAGVSAELPTASWGAMVVVALIPVIIAVCVTRSMRRALARAALKPSGKGASP